MMGATQLDAVSETAFAFTKTFLLFLLVAVGLHSFLQGTDNIMLLLGQSCVAALVYTAVYLAVFSLSPWSLSLSWLGLPLLLFAATWLRWYWAIALTVSLLAALFLAIRSDRVATANLPTSRSMSFSHLVDRGFVWGALPVLCWVALSGAGGYGFQSQDYVMHNGRLEDLVRHAWPVFYQGDEWLNGQPDRGDRRLLVTYSGYYLPAAAIGKFFGLDIAREFMHYWTLAGCWLACRWLLQHSAIKSTMLAAVVLILFGGWDIVGLIVGGFYYIHQHGISFAEINQSATSSGIPTPEILDFWPNGILESDYFFGNFVSLSTSLIWAPHQSIAGWLVMALLLQTAQQQSYRYTGLIYATLALWSPMALIALALFPLAIFLLPIMFRNKKQYWAEWISLANLSGALLLLILGFYYASASMLTNPAGFLELKNAWAWAVLILFHMLCWGIYAAAIYPALHDMTIAARQFFMVLCLTFFLLPFLHYGTYNDLMVRASAPLLFGLAIFMLKSLALYLCNGKSRHALIIIALLLPGMFSGLFNLSNAIMNHDHKVKGESVIDYGGGWQFLGSTDSVFARYFSSRLPEDGYINKNEGDKKHGH
jgi:hypothetical protein